MQVVNDSAESAILLAKTYHNKLTTNPNEKSHLYQMVPTWYPLRRKIPDKRKSTLTNVVDDINTAKSTLNEKCCDIKTYHNQKLYKLFFVCL